MASKLKTYQVSAWVKVLCTCNVKAATFEEAGREAATLKTSDFLEILGEHVDGEGPTVDSIYLEST